MRLREDDVFFDYGCGALQSRFKLALDPPPPWAPDPGGDGRRDRRPILAMRARTQPRMSQGAPGDRRRLDVICDDASEMELPDHATLVYLYSDPFFEIGPGAGRDADSRLQSIDGSPVRLRVLSCFNPATGSAQRQASPGRTAGTSSNSTIRASARSGHLRLPFESGSNDRGRRVAAFESGGLNCRRADSRIQCFRFSARRRDGSQATSPGRFSSAVGGPR